MHSSSEIIEKLSGRLVVSCQAVDGSYLRQPDILARMAAEACANGAAGVRLDGPDTIEAARRLITALIIGIHKRSHPDYPVRITISAEEAVELVKAGADLVAIDATARPHPEPFDRIAAAVHQAGGLVLADISSCPEAVAAAGQGADFVVTTLSGYTAATHGVLLPNIDLIAELSRELTTPVLGEGGFSTRGQVEAALEAGALGVVVGRAITDVGFLTRSFVPRLRKTKRPMKMEAGTKR